VWVVVHTPGWPRVQASFLDSRVFWSSLPGIVEAFGLNILIFMTAEVLVLVFGLVLAIMRGLSGPVFLPFRVLSNAFTDVFRALPGLLVIAVLGFGIPALGIVDPKTPVIIYGIAALTLIYSAYVAEVYRAGIESIHPSQAAAARSLGLSHLQTLRHVIVPQAVRRVIPPLLNDFIGLQKDTVLVSTIGVVEIFRMTQIKNAAAFNFTPYLGVGLVFVVITIPMIHLVDWLVARDRRRAAKSGA
jgi:polar amino acid transport system permease protein